VKLSFSHEPVAWTTAIAAIIALCAAFGLKLTSDQREAILALIPALVGLGLVARSQVVPSIKVAENFTPNEKVVSTTEGPGPAAKSQGGPGVTKALLVGLISLVLAGPARAATTAPADTNRSVLDISRLAGGIDGGLVTYSDLRGMKQDGFRVAPWLSYDLTDVLSIVGKEGWDVRWGRFRTCAGARACVVGNGENDRIAAYLSIDRTWNSGKAPFVPEKMGWAPGINLAWVAVTKGDRDLVYVKPQVAYDTMSGWDVFIGAGLLIFGGGN
jgi:hypothetical protein